MCPLMWSSLPVYLGEGVLISFSRHIGPGLTRMAPFLLECLLTGSISNYNHVLRYWGDTTHPITPVTTEAEIRVTCLEAKEL